MSVKKIHCSNPHCENEIATLVEIEGREIIDIGGLLVNKIDGACIKCGTKFHWSITDKMLEDLVKRVQNH